MWNKKKKMLASAITVILVAALALAGTFAWSSDDSSDGEEEGVKAPNVRLHDDYDKTNIAGLTNGAKYRKIYVENTGDVNLYVRVKLSEYMNKGNRPLILNTSKANKNSWKPRYSDDGLEFSGTEIDKYISLDTGKGKTTDYVKDVKNNYADTDNDGTADDAVTAEPDANKKGTTPAGQVMTMKEWKKLSVVPTDGCWVLDTDGYAYWSQKLAADKATSLLLNMLTIHDIDESYYYGLSVGMEAITESDLESWINGTKLSDGKVPSQASKDAAGILKNLSSEYVKISSAMKATMPSANTYDNDGDGYLTNAQNKKYETAVAEVTAAVTAINGATVDDAAKDIVTIGGVEWRVLSKTADKAELITKDMVTRMKYAKEGVTDYPKWSESGAREFLNVDYYAALSDGLKAMIKEETIQTPTAFNALTDLEETQDKVYLLGEGITASALDNTVVTLGDKVLTSGAEQLKCVTTTLDGQYAAGWWLRTPRINQVGGGLANASSGLLYTTNVSNANGIRAAITVNLK